MGFDLERLYNMLPAVYRMRDFQEGEPLKALLSVMVEQIEALEEDLAQLYDDQFIETCADWVVPYIGNLLGYRSLHGVTPAVNRPRAEIANLISFRRRKGTISMLEQLARDVTGWDVRVVEFFQLLATTQYMNHLRPKNQVSPDLRSWRVSQYLNTPFDQTPHLADVRCISSSRGCYNIPNIGIFLWRLYAYPIKSGTPHEVISGCYTFDPLGRDIPLFNSPQPEREITHLAEPVNVPQTIKRRPLLQDLKNFRQMLTDSEWTSDSQSINDSESVQVAFSKSLYFGQNPFFTIYINKEPVPAQEIAICDLTEWNFPAENIRYYPRSALTDSENSSTENAASVDYPIKVAVDPQLGRFAFAKREGTNDLKIEVSYFYGFSTDLGGGGYTREDITASLPASAIKVIVGDQTLSQAIGELSNKLEKSNDKKVHDTIIEIENSSTFEENLEITLKEGQKLIIKGGEKLSRPVLKGVITINSAENAEVILDGLLIANYIEIKGTGALTVTVRHCTISPWLIMGSDGLPLLPAEPSLKWDTPISGDLIIDHTITGRLRVARGINVKINDSIVDGLKEDNTLIAACEDRSSPAGKVTILRSTLIGRVEVQEIKLAENSIFIGQVNSRRKQEGCIRFCYLSPDSQVPCRYYCQPDLAIKLAHDSARKQDLSIGEASLKKISDEIHCWFKPVFTSRLYGHPGYAQLHASCPLEIRAGADDGSEIGAFHDLYTNMREADLRERLDEYLRLGLEAGIFYVN